MELGKGSSMAAPQLRRIAGRVALLLAAPILLGSLGPRDRFEERLLAAHNRERVAAGLAPLRWNPQLANAAGGWARQLAASGRFEHSPDEPHSRPQGENLWAGTAGYFQPEAMVGLWIAEKRNFKPGTFPDNSRTGRVEAVSHYTQLMWRRTDQVGCAIRRGRAEEVLVCRYSEAGNVLGEKPF